MVKEGLYKRLMTGRALVTMSYHLFPTYSKKNVFSKFLFIFSLNYSFKCTRALSVQYTVIINFINLLILSICLNNSRGFTRIPVLDLRIFHSKWQKLPLFVAYSLS